MLFDLDGVLVDSRLAWHGALNAVRASFGLSEVPTAVYDPRFGQSVVDDAAFFFEGRLSPEALSRAYVEALPPFLGAVKRLDEDAGATLDELRAHGLGLAVTTNSPRETAWALLGAVGLSEAFSAVVTADDVPRPKPAPDMLLTACARLGIEPAGALLVGDSETDAAAARAADVRIVSYRSDEAPTRIDRLRDVIAMVTAR